MDKFELEFSDYVTELDVLATERPLAFLTEARSAAKSYTRQMRRQAKRLQSGDMTALDFYLLWQCEYSPWFQQIFHNVASGKLKRPLKSVLLAQDDQASEWLSQEILDLCARRGREKITEAYSGARKRVRVTLAEMLARSDASISRQVERSIVHEVYQLVARRHNLVIDDPQLGLWRRMFRRLRVRRQEKRIVTATMASLRQVQAKNSEFAELHGGIIPRLSELNIDVISVLAARQAYEKALKKATPSPTEKLNLYEEKTAKIRVPYLNEHGTAGIKELQDAARQIDEVLLAVFDLETADKNSLLGAAKEYQELALEKQALDARLSRSRG